MTATPRHSDNASGHTADTASPGDPAGITPLAAMLPLQQLDAVLLGLDGVLTNTATLDECEVTPLPGAHDLLRELCAAGVDVAVVSASQHTTEILAAAGLTSLVDVVIDGVIAAEMLLTRRPDPATYREAASRLGVRPDRSAVVESDPAGLAAGRAGGFCLVVGVTRRDDPESLRAAGADLIVDGLEHLAASGPGPLTDGWHLTYRPTSNAAVGLRETLLTLANGYLGTRGAATWAEDDGVHYPGTYLAGVYNTLSSKVDGRRIDRESIINAPNWLPLSFAMATDPYLPDSGVTVADEDLRLDLRNGLLRRRYRLRDSAGRRTAVTELRLVSIADPHLAAMQIEVVAENWSGELRVRSGIDTTCCADQTSEAKRLEHCHLRLVEAAHDDPATILVTARTTGTATLIAVATRTHVQRGADPASSPIDESGPGWDYRVRVRAGQRIHVEKVAAHFTSRDPAVTDVANAARAAVAEAPGFCKLESAQSAAWARLWQLVRTDVLAVDWPTGLMNLHLFHVLQVASLHLRDVDAGLPARGLHGEGYEGHVFWDELFVTRMLDLRLPAISRAALTYRRRRLGAARQAARVAGDSGARYPWQSAGDGREVTPRTLYNSRSGRWMPDRSAGQRHVGLAVAYQMLHHLDTSGENGFLDDAATIVLEVARHFAHLADYQPTEDRYHLRAVMGPDEFHDGYPWRKEPGVDDNAYTNVLTAWLCARAAELAGRLADAGRDDVLLRTGVGSAERTLFDAVSRRMFVPFHDGLISQFAGYERLKWLDINAYKARYGNIGRLDLILDAEGDSVRRYQVAKQADTLMLLYLLSPAELEETLHRLGHALSEAQLRETIDFYTARTVHGSTLSTVVHAWVAARMDPSTSWHRLGAALAADMADTQGGTTREGIHLGAMAGTVDLLQRCYLGLDSRAAELVLDPALPPEIDRLHVTLAYRGQQLDVTLSQIELVIEAGHSTTASTALVIRDERLMLAPGDRIHRRLTAGGCFPTHPFTLAADRKPRAASTDPVCGMMLDASTAAASAVYRDLTYYFCSPTCHTNFEAAPERYSST
jgi:HAD superfamily hydrolase (TIGR01509 family)